MLRTQLLKYDEHFRVASPSPSIAYSTKTLTSLKNTSQTRVFVEGNYAYSRLANTQKQCVEITEKFSTLKLIEVPLVQFFRPELPNIHKALSPFYVILALFASVLVVNIGVISTNIGFYQFISNLGIFTTILAAIAYVYLVYRRANQGKL